MKTLVLTSMANSRRIIACENNSFYEVI